MADQQGNIPKGGTMRLGKYPCTVKPGTKMAECYGEPEIWERHRHRYEFNNDFRSEMDGKGSGHFRHQPRTAVWSRPWSCRAAPSIWVPSSTRSSRAAPTARIPCSRASSQQLSSSVPPRSAA